MANNNKKYIYYSGNISNINRLSEALSNHRHASALDRIAFFSLNSTYRLPKEDEIVGWFTIKYEELGKLIGYKERTIKAIIKKFVEMKLLERTFRIIKNTRRSCLRITNKTKALLNLSTKQHSITPQVILKTTTSAELTTQKSSISAKKCTSESAKNALPYIEYREKEKDINIITRPSRSEKQSKPYNTPENVQNIFNKIGERLEQPQKAKIWGAVCNLKKQHGKTISNVSEFIAWISFSIINAKYQLKNALNFDHQLNAIMKIARTKEGLKRPRGFHNHWDIGIELKSKEKQTLKNHKQTKNSEYHLNSGIEIHDFDSSSNSIGYVVAKKAKELWGDNGEIALLKSSRANIITDINSFMADNNALKKIFANEPVLKATQTEKNNTQIDILKKELSVVNEKIASFKIDKDNAKAQEWKTLYE